MIVLPPTLLARLRFNDFARRAAERHGKTEPDPLPVLKLYNPLGAATWIVTEIQADGDTLFGLADLGLGCPELGYCSLREIGALRLPFGLGIERDCRFRTDQPLSAWVEAARRTGSAFLAEFEFRRETASKLPPPIN